MDRFPTVPPQISDILGSVSVKKSGFKNYEKLEKQWIIFKTFKGSPNYALSNHTTFSQFKLARQTLYYNLCRHINVQQVELVQNIPLQKEWPLKGIHTEHKYTLLCNRPPSLNR